MCSKRSYKEVGRARTVRKCSRWECESALKAAQGYQKRPTDYRLVES